MSQEKPQNLRISKQEQGVDLVALGPSSHMQWLVDFHPHSDERPCLLLVSPTAETFLMRVTSLWCVFVKLVVIVDSLSKYDFF